MDCPGIAVYLDSGRLGQPAPVEANVLVLFVPQHIFHALLVRRGNLGWPASCLFPLGIVLFSKIFVNGGISLGF